MGLDVGVLGSEELFGAVAGYGFNDIGELAAAVVALAGVAFGVFVGEYGACGFEDGAADEVFRGDHLEAFVLADDLVFYLRCDVGVGGGEGRVQVDGHVGILCGKFFGVVFCGFCWGFWGKWVLRVVFLWRRCGGLSGEDGLWEDGF